MGAALCAPSVGPGGGGQHRPSCPHPLLTSARRAQCFLQADPFPCSSSALQHQLPSISIFTLWPGKGLAFWGGGRAGWATQLHFLGHLTTLPPPRLPPGPEILKGSHTSRPQTRTGVLQATASGADAASRC